MTMTTQEMIAVMQAAVEGKEIESKSLNEGEWKVNPYPMWKWSDFDYRVKPTTPRRVFTLADFPPGTLVRNGGWDSDTWKLVTERKIYGILCGSLEFDLISINVGRFHGWSFSTDSGKTWEKMAP